MTKIHRYMPMEMRFWLQVRKSDGCWEWIGPKNEGYGLITVDAVSKRATHVAWYLANGEWPTLLVCHSCDNRSCVRVDHLFLGTAADNNRDAMAKGRRGGWPKRNQTGACNGRAKLTNVDVRCIMESDKSARALAAEYGVVLSTIHRVRRGEWGTKNTTEGLTP